jgi:hypothetical protein
MTNPFIQIGNEVREMTKDELAQWKSDKAEAEAFAEALTDRQAAKDAVLAKLGLSADELAALLGA